MKIVSLLPSATEIVDALRLEAMAWAIHPEAFPEPPCGAVVRIAG